MANPYTSKWNNTPKTPKKVNPKIYAIKKHITTNVRFYDHTVITILTANNTIYLAKNSQKFRLKSHLDWAWYSPKTLALAIDNSDVDVYYERQLHHHLSDPNIWKRWDEEQDLKSYYAARAGRASLI